MLSGVRLRFPARFQVLVRRARTDCHFVRGTESPKSAVKRNGTVLRFVVDSPSLPHLVAGLTVGSLVISFLFDTTILTSS